MSKARQYLEERSRTASCIYCDIDDYVDPSCRYHDDHQEMEAVPLEAAKHAIGVARHEERKIIVEALKLAISQVGADSQFSKGVLFSLNKIEAIQKSNE